MNILPVAFYVVIAFPNMTTYQYQDLPSDVLSKHMVIDWDEKGCGITTLYKNGGWTLEACPFDVQ